MVNKKLILKYNDFTLIGKTMNICSKNLESHKFFI